MHAFDFEVNDKDVFGNGWHATNQCPCTCDTACLHVMNAVCAYVNCLHTCALFNGSIEKIFLIFFTKMAMTNNFHCLLDDELTISVWTFKVLLLRIILLNFSLIYIKKVTKIPLWVQVD